MVDDLISTVQLYRLINVGGYGQAGEPPVTHNYRHSDDAGHLTADIDEYLLRHFEPYATAGGSFTAKSKGYQKHGRRALKIFNAFFLQEFGSQQIKPDHFVPYLFYRVCGEPGSENVHSGACGLQTFFVRRSILLLAY